MSIIKIKTLNGNLETGLFSLPEFVKEVTHLSKLTLQDTCEIEFLKANNLLKFHSLQDELNIRRGRNKARENIILENINGDYLGVSYNVEEDTHDVQFMIKIFHSQLVGQGVLKIKYEVVNARYPDNRKSLERYLSDKTIWEKGSYLNSSLNCTRKAEGYYEREFYLDQYITLKNFLSVILQNQPSPSSTVTEQSVYLDGLSLFY